MHFFKLPKFKIRTVVTLSEKYILSNKKLLYMQILFNLISITILFSIISANTFSFAIAFIEIIGVFLMIKVNHFLKKYRSKVFETLYIRDKLTYILATNKLYISSTDNDGKRYISRSAVLSFLVEDDCIVVRAHITGDNFSKQLRELALNLSSALGIRLEEQKDNPEHSDFLFLKKRPERLYVSSNGKKDMNNNLPINLGYGVVYNPVKCPHILVAGGTGSGKSLFISYLLIEFLRKSENSIYICDPKNSDLGSLSHYLGEERVATTPNNIARVVRLAIAEMQNRYDYMNENFKYGSNFVDHGYNPIWLIFDEMGAFQASGTDKKSKEVVNEVMDRIKQIILLGRQAGVFILIAAQQMNANTINTDLRDNLGLRIALGANSSEGYRMIFGSNTPENIPSIETKGAGLLYMQGSGKETAQYWESPFIDMKKFDFIEELKRYV
ncbi:FtsK/SpoIIIE domain-containing protein [Viridibacillus sp. FSL H8-0123]|uniref:FtsK/SpoIIIE domain-containing protein n=1 Tax=Viridibacillus sp. FSL H8-0123 TaxID=1928922 RepID=UPI0009700EEC|nr:FtsK/SpoIIIE domain-containing protein [Viridibacillus sp. FSL H8-0123]OMC78452.1 otitis media-associated H10 [Viridibacillus sp. FSL H8-0123]